MTMVLTRRMQLALTAGIFLAVAPTGITFDLAKGAFDLGAPMAQARGGSDDSSGDDHGGSRGSDDSGHHSSSHDGDDDSGHRGRGRGRGGDDSSHHSRNSSGTAATGGAAASGGNGGSVVKFETYANGLEVTFSDGSKIEIENGRYERKNTAGRTVEERRATQADVDQLLALR